MNSIDKALLVSQMWHEILMKSSTADDVEKYKSLMSVSPVEIRIILITATTPNLLLREYIKQLNIPKSTFTSIVNRLEKNGYLKRVINTRDMRSFGLELQQAGLLFAQTYMEYQKVVGTKIMNGLSEQEQEQLITLLTKISSYMIIE